MEQTASIIVISIILLGILVYIFHGDHGVNQTILDGHEQIKEELRSWGYSAE